MNKSFYFKTQVGGCASILAIAFVIAFFWASSRKTIEKFLKMVFMIVILGIGSFFNREDVIVVNNRIYDPDPPK